MSDGSVGLVVLLLIAIGSALLWHRFVSAFFVAALGTTLTAVVVFQGAVFVELGDLDPFFLIAAATSCVVAAAVAIVVGLHFAEGESAMQMKHARLNGSMDVNLQLRCLTLQSRVR